MSTSVPDLDTAVEAAHTAFLLGRRADLTTRAGWLEAAAAAMEEDADILVPLAARETNLGVSRLQGELKRTVFQLRLFAAEIRSGEHLDATIDHADPGWGMGARPDLRRMNVPLGVVGIFGASNFPFAFSVMGGDSASALAAGCSVVYKAHEGHPGLSLRTAEAVQRGFRKAGAPEALFTLITGRAAAEALVDHPLVKAIGFTGSTAGGRALAGRAFSRPEPIPFYGELGGINAVFVTESAWSVRRDSILSGYAASLSLGMGQFCTKPGLLFVPRGATAEAGELLRAAFKDFEPAPLLTEGLHAGYRNAVKEVAGQPGVETVVKGNFDSAPMPTVLRAASAAVFAQPELLRQEMFGPASLLVEYRDGSELMALAGLLEGQLTTTLQAEADDDVSELAARLADISGRVLWNGWPTGVTVSFAQHHGGPYPATTSATTSVGTAAVGRFMRPVAHQDFPASRLPEPLQDTNPWSVPQRIDGTWSRPQQKVEAS